MLSRQQLQDLGMVENKGIEGEKFDDTYANKKYELKDHLNSHIKTKPMLIVRKAGLSKKQQNKWILHYKY